MKGILYGAVILASLPSAASSQQSYDCPDGRRTTASIEFNGPSSGLERYVGQYDSNSGQGTFILEFNLGGDIITAIAEGVVALSDQRNSVPQGTARRVIMLEEDHLGSLVEEIQRAKANNENIGIYGTINPSTQAKGIYVLHGIQFDSRIVQFCFNRE